MEKNINTNEEIESSNQKPDSKIKKISKTYSILSRIWFVVFNLAYIIAYSVYTGYAIVNKNQEVSWLPYALGAFILLYWAFLFYAIFTGSKEKLKSTKKDYKASFKIIKKLFKLINLIMTAMLTANTFVNDRESIFGMVLTIISIVYVVYQIIHIIVKYFKRKKKEKQKAQKKAIKNEFISDMKSMYTDGKAEWDSLNKDGENNEQAECTTVIEETKPAKKGVSAKIDNLNDKINVVANNATKFGNRIKQYNEDTKSVNKKPDKKK